MPGRLISSLRQRQQSWILFSFLRKPYSRRDAAFRALVAGAVAVAIVGPILIGRGGGGATAGAGEAFTAKLAEIEALEDRRDAEGASDELDARIEALRNETRLGYLERDGDASDRGALAPDFRLLDLEGEPWRLAEIAGPVVLNFWASWCEPCIEEMPEFEIVSNELAGRVTFIGLNDGESPEIAREFAYDVTGVSYLVLLDPTKSMTNGPYLLVGRPTTFFIGADGIIQDLRVGIVDIGTLRELSGRLIGEELSAPEEDAAPAEYGEAALELIESARANFAVSDDLIGRWRADASVLADPGWQRNVTAQTMVWSDLVEQFQSLTPPDLWSDLHEAVADSLAQIANAAGPLVRQAVEGEDAGGLAIAAQLYESFRGLFDTAAENLAGVVRTQQ